MTSSNFVIADAQFFSNLKDDIVRSVCEQISNSIIDKKPDRWLLAEEACDYLRCSLSTLNRRVKEGLAYRQDGRVRRFRQSALDQWMTGKRSQYSSQTRGI